MTMGIRACSASGPHPTCVSVRKRTSADYAEALVPVLLQEPTSRQLLRLNDFIFSNSSGVSVMNPCRVEPLGILGLLLSECTTLVREF